MSFKRVIFLLPGILLLLACNETPGLEKKDAVNSLAVYNHWDAILQQETENKEVDWILIKAIILKESHFDSTFVSTAGAVGLMQLMPREGSFITDHYRFFQKARRQKRNAEGKRMYQGRSDVEWARRYVADLDSLKKAHLLNPKDLYQLDTRFDPPANIREGTRQFTSDFQYFRGRGHGPYTSRILSLAAYNAGRGAVVKNKENTRQDRIPINRQTELYVAYVEKIYEMLKSEGGKVNERNAWILNL